MGDEVDAIVDAWRRERPDLDVSPMQVLSRVSRLADLLDDRRAAAFVEHGLQAHEFDVLAALRRSGEPFEMTAGELCTATHVTSGTMTSRLDRLVSRKLVIRRPDEVDGRLVRVRLTGSGRRRVDDHHFLEFGSTPHRRPPFAISLRYRARSRDSVRQECAVACPADRTPAAAWFP